MGISLNLPVTVDTNRTCSVERANTNANIQLGIGGKELLEMASLTTEGGTNRPGEKDK